MSKPVANDTRDQVQRILATLSRHGDIISKCLTGSITEADDVSQKGIEALLGVNALMPVQEGVYQLNPRIRSYLSERLSQYGAMQTLTRISEQIHGGRAKWRELVEMRRSGDVQDISQIEESLSYTLNEIVYFMGQNLRLLNYQTATEYGNVESMKRKLSQNRFYADSVRILLSELDQLREFVDTVDNEALAYGLHEMRQLCNSRMKSRMADWRVQLNDIQATISKRLFTKRKIERELRILYDAVLWMVKNPSSSGIEVEPGPDLKVALLSPTPIRVRPRIDINSTGLAQEKMLQTVTARLPAPKLSQRPPEPKIRQQVHSTTMEEIDVPMREEDLMLEELMEYLMSSGAKPIEISRWQPERRLQCGISEEAWLIYAACQLAVRGIHTELQMTRTPDTCNAVFDDVMAFTGAIA